MASLLQEIEAQISGAKSVAIKRSIGVIREIGDGVARVEGLGDVMLTRCSISAAASPAWR